MISVSACMIVKDEAENLPRCLKSIEPMIDELIIVDTGSSDNTIEIAKSFNARVYEHPWENDFSKHRNQSIRYATKDWVFIIDADEEVFFGPDGVSRLKDYTLPIIEKQGNAAAVLLKDIQKGKVLMKFSTGRFFKNGTVRYEGIVHNHPIVDGSVIVIPETIVYMHHYGYDLTPEKKQQKFDRSVGLLKQRLRDNPKDYICYFYLFEFYAVHKRYGEAAQFGQKYLKYKDILKRKHHFNPSIYYGMARNYMEMKDYKSAEKIFTEGLKESPRDIDLAFGLADYGVRVQRPDLIVLGARQYLTLYKQYTDTPSTRSGNFIYSYNPENRIYVMCNLVLAQLNEACDTLDQIRPALAKTKDDFRKKVGESFIKDAEKVGLGGFVRSRLDLDGHRYEIPVSRLDKPQSAFRQFSFN